MRTQVIISVAISLLLAIDSSAQTSLTSQYNGYRDGDRLYRIVANDTTLGNRGDSCVWELPALQEDDNFFKQTVYLRNDSLTIVEGDLMLHYIATEQGLSMRGFQTRVRVKARAVQRHDDVVEPHPPVVHQVLEKMTVGGKFTALESEPLEITDGKQCRYREQGEQHEKDGGLEILLVQHFRQGKQDKGQQAENRFLAGLCKEGEGEGEERPVDDVREVYPNFEEGVEGLCSPLRMKRFLANYSIRR